MEESEKKDYAWLGDAVLSLFAREWLLKKTALNFAVRTEEFVAMTSNQFLKSIGEPTAVEAKIGKIYHEDGLESAFHWIEKELVPLYEKQRANKLRGKQGKRG